MIKAAQKALEMGNGNLVLIWVQQQDEAEIKEAFQKTLAVRQLSPEAKELADRYFFETLVRVHRAGEGAPYTGLNQPGAISVRQSRRGPGTGGWLGGVPAETLDRHRARWRPRTVQRSHDQKQFDEMMSQQDRHM